MRRVVSSGLSAAIVAITLCVSSLLPLLCCKTDAASPGAKFWPSDAEGALSLTFDDGMPSQLERAVPILDRMGLKASFYVNPGFSVDWERTSKQWHALSVSGHELANHTDTHPCSCQSDYRHGSDYCLEKLDLKEIARSIDDAERALAALTMQPIETRSFAYPCYNTDVGAGANRVSYIPLVAKRYSAARVGWQQTGNNDPATVDLSHISSFSAEGRTADEMIAYIEGSMRSGRWAVLVFHGIGSEWSATDISQFNDVIDYVSRNRSRIWVAPLVQVANHIRANRIPPYRD